METAYEETRPSLAKRRAPTAIVSLSNFMTIGVMRALSDLGVRCPEEVSLIGVDDLDWADIMRIRPTLIAQPIEEMTRTAIAALLDQLTIAAPPLKRRILFPPKLTEREYRARRPRHPDEMPRRGHRRSYPVALLRPAARASMTTNAWA